MHDSARNIAESFRCSLLVYEWGGFMQVSPSGGGGGTPIGPPIKYHNSLINHMSKYIGGGFCSFTVFS